MTYTRGVFRLLEVVESKLKGEWISLNDVWISPSGSPTPNTGYFGGGYDGTNPRSTMDKVTYSSDTTAAVPGAPLSVARHGVAATGSSTAGYFGGGGGLGAAPGYSTMDKVTYSSDTTAAVPGARLSVARGWLAATGNSTAGYFGGGFYYFFDPFWYSEDQGGTSYMDKVTYSSDTIALVPGAALSASRYLLAATGSSTAGYFGGGIDIYAPSAQTRMDKVTYSTDTTAQVPGASLSTQRQGLVATGNSTAGYFGGGTNPSFPRQSTMDKVTYSTDTTAVVPGAALSAGRYNLAATGNSTNGYFGGGSEPGVRSTMDKIDYATDTRLSAVPGANLSVARSYLAATGSSTAGYFGGGAGPHSTMDKVTYSSDTTAAVPGAFLSAARGYLTATGSSTAGYFGGGTPGVRSTMDKVTYSSDTTAAVPGAALSVGRYSLAASSARANALPQPPAATPTPQTSSVSASAPNTGYFGGGPGPFSTMDKVTYASDTTAAVPGAALSVARSSLAATGSSTAGYFGGGYNPGARSTMDKVTYVSDTTAAVPGASLSGVRYSLAATGNSTAALFGGGYNPTPYSVRSTMDKVTYSSDTTAQVPGAALSVDRYNLAASSARANALPTTLTSPAPNIV